MVAFADSPPVDVIICVENTVNMGFHIDDLKTQYLQPTLDHFNGGASAMQLDYSSVDCASTFTLIPFKAADCLPEPPARVLGPFTSTMKVTNSLEKLNFTGGCGERFSSSQEALSLALQVLDDLKQRHTAADFLTSRHIVLVTTTPPYDMNVMGLRCGPLSSGIGPRANPHAGKSIGELAMAVRDRGITLSVISPRKIPFLFQLYEMAGGDLLTAKEKNFALVPRHTVLLSGYSLQERPHPPSSVNNGAGGLVPPNHNRPQQTISPSLGNTNTVGNKQQPHMGMGGGTGQGPNQGIIQQTGAGGQGPMMQVGGNQGQGPMMQGGGGGQGSMMQGGGGGQGSMMQGTGGGGQGPMLQGYQHPNSMVQGMQQQQDLRNMQQQQVGNTNMVGGGGAPMGQQQSYGSGGGAGGSGGPGANQQGNSGPNLLQTALLRPPANNTNGENQTLKDLLGQKPLNPIGNNPQQQMGNYFPRMPQQQQQGMTSQAGMTGMSNNPMSTMGNNNPMASTCGGIVPSMNVMTTGGGSTGGGAGGMMGMSGSGGPMTSQQQQQQQMQQQMMVGGGMMRGMGQAREKEVIWKGELEWQEKVKDGAGDQKISHSVACTVSTSTENGQPEVKPDNWPNKLIMQLIPKTLVQTIGGLYFRNSKQVFFHPTECESLEALTKVMGTGFAGCVHFTGQCEIKVLILLYSNEKKTYLGFIPNDQMGFVERIRSVIQQQKTGQLRGGIGHPQGGQQQMTIQQQQQQQMMVSQGNMMPGGGMINSQGGMMNNTMISQGGQVMVSSNMMNQQPMVLMQNAGGGMVRMQQQGGPAPPHYMRMPGQRQPIMGGGGGGAGGGPGHNPGLRQILAQQQQHGMQQMGPGMQPQGGGMMAGPGGMQIRMGGQQQQGMQQQNDPLLRDLLN